MAWLTQQDVQDYGTDLIDVVQRGALNAVAPHLQNLNSRIRNCASAWPSRPAAISISALKRPCPITGRLMRIPGGISGCWVLTCYRDACAKFCWMTRSHPAMPLASLISSGNS